MPTPLAATLSAWLAAAVTCLLAVLPGDARAETQALRIVGGLAGVNQYTRHEEPFWTRELPRLTAGRLSAEIVPFDRAGLRGQEMLTLMRLGVVPFGTAILSLSAGGQPELGAPDLAGLSPDMPTLRRVVAAYRPHLTALLRERFGVELLAVYVYPAQVTFCTKPFAGLAGLAGRRVRTSSVTQADWLEALGATPVQTAFAELLPQLRAGNIDCAITGTMSGNTIGLHELTTQLHTMPVTWGLSIFAANGGAWQQLPDDLRGLLRRELARLEAAIWDESERETAEGVACNTGAAGCPGGRAGRMSALRPSPADEQRRREILEAVVLPRWLQRCGAPCAPVWNQTIGPAVGIPARPR
ncbi:MAG: TRAP transporter substrate-binding protein [Rubrivivax sp.]|jgi:TRAP-type C4-dicarboxylate transport system substrate-binding protein|nr:TRAP transporter substrate-binding protein [Rubrivivax sp.]